MAKGEPAAPFERLRPYLQGARFALVAVRRMHSSIPEVEADCDRYIEIIKEYVWAVEETYKLKRERDVRSEIPAPPPTEPLVINPLA